jgi:hypothetical protein
MLDVPRIRFHLIILTISLPMHSETTVQADRREVIEEISRISYRNIEVCAGRHGLNSSAASVEIMASTALVHKSKCVDPQKLIEG